MLLVSFKREGQLLMANFSFPCSATTGCGGSIPAIDFPLGVFLGENDEGFGLFHLTPSTTTSFPSGRCVQCDEFCSIDENSIEELREKAKEHITEQFNISLED